MPFEPQYDLINGIGRQRVSARVAPSGDEDDFPRDVTGLELGERRANLVERVGALDRHDQVARRYGLGQFGQHQLRDSDDDQDQPAPLSRRRPLQRGSRRSCR